MTIRMLAWLTPEDWVRGLAFVILWGYGYQLVAWPILWWIASMLNAFGIKVILPPVIPWEQLGAAAVTIGTVSGIKTWGESKQPGIAPP